MVILADEGTALCVITLIADQKIEPSRPSAELMAENSVSDGEVKTVDQGESSAAPVPSAEK
ncbi:MAG: hypothetical protein V7L31_13535 [Nostoc sp.]|uniref:hypothetical protein n=1 Tax=Nostoc sp. TaxID=1180 RepID=UPI002FF0D9E0